MASTSESQLEGILGKLQSSAEQAPEDVRIRRRLILRGVRCALNILTDDLSPAQARAELLRELGITVPEPPRTALSREETATDLQRAILQRLDAGMRVCDICRELGCGASAVNYVRNRYGG
ncbi:helix-turn-helix domain-containing protein [Pseudomonas putida]|uniref:helix-turn-helix domain-containing protein n=1 Tax=Pseudomonas putida TaxID=303 RepID=UPI003F7A1903